jgi:hypothetical protein
MRENYLKEISIYIIDKFIDYISDDLNTANAITLLYDLLKR